MPERGSGMVRGPLPCVGCGYDLRNLPKSHACPECGRAIEDTLNATPAPAGLRGTVWLLITSAGAAAAATILLEIDQSHRRYRVAWLETAEAAAAWIAFGVAIGSIIHFWRWPTLPTLITTTICCFVAFVTISAVLHLV